MSMELAAVTKREWKCVYVIMSVQGQKNDNNKVLVFESQRFIAVAHRNYRRSSRHRVKTVYDSLFCCEDQSAYSADIQRHTECAGHRTKTPTPQRREDKMDGHLKHFFLITCDERRVHCWWRTPPYNCVMGSVTRACWEQWELNSPHECPWKENNTRHNQYTCVLEIHTIMV